MIKYIGSIFLIFVLSILPISSWSSPLSIDKNPSYKVICQNSKECPSSVAGILSEEKNVCTGVLVRPDVIATNLHCLPPNLRFKNASCKNLIKFSFPENRDFPEEYLECKKVISVSSALKDTPLTPDYAFLQLGKKSKRPPVTINSDGVENNEILTVYKIDPVDEMGLLRKMTCKAAQGSVLNPLFKSAQSSVISLIPCSIISGNSGSPIFSNMNEIKGLINSKGLPADIPLSNDKFEVAYASNFSCLDIPELGFSKNRIDCQSALDRRSFQNASGLLVRDAVRTLMPDFSKNVGAQFQNIHEQTRNFIRWETHQQDIPYTGNEKQAIAKVIFKPKCIDTSRAHLQNRQELIAIKYSEWGIELHLDPVGRPNPSLAENEVHGTLSFSKKDLNLKDLPIQLNQAQFTVPFCSDLLEP